MGKLAKDLCAESGAIIGSLTFLGGVAHAFLPSVNCPDGRDENPMPGPEDPRSSSPIFLSKIFLAGFRLRRITRAKPWHSL
jgi:hypothetical protein